MSSWITCKLGDIANINMGQSPPSTSYNEEGIGMKFYQGRVDFCFKHVLPRVYTTKPKKIANPGDILLTVRAPVGDLNITKDECCIGRGIASLRMKNHLQEFLYFLLKQYSSYWVNTSTGSVFSSINKRDIDELTIRIPTSFDEQKQIASILSSLDDKIELNLEMNKTMEEMAMSIYKEWFVDFGPFRDGEFVDSELGSIPKGWNVANLKDVCLKITKGTTPTTLKRKFTKSGISFIKVESLTNEGSFIKNKFAFIDIETNEILKRSKIQNKDILYSIAGTIGRIGIVSENILPANTNQALAIIRSNIQKIDPYLLYYIIKSHITREQLFPNIVQAVQANLSLLMLSNLKILIPTRRIALDFIRIITPLRDMIEGNNYEIELLSDIRDYLLPKLISGEVRVKAAEEKLKEVL